MTIPELNKMNGEHALSELFKCCGSQHWAQKLTDCRPFSNIQDLIGSSDRIWMECDRKDALEAFSHHPKIGDLKSLEKKFATTREWASGEQAGLKTAAGKIIQELAAGNAAYESKFGYIFIVCATGKSAEEMLGLLQSRIGNDAETELKIAMIEQNKITHLRLEKLFA
jgi:2-oxo-4-hydroxy-4-carboxy-5-ureidoimidazoline decarboxylase